MFGPNKDLVKDIFSDYRGPVPPLFKYEFLGHVREQL